MTGDKEFVYLLAFDCAIFIGAFFLTGDLMFFWFGLFMLLFYYHALSWQLEVKWIKDHTMTEAELIEALDKQYGVR